MIHHPPKRLRIKKARKQEEAMLRCVVVRFYVLVSLFFVLLVFFLGRARDGRSGRRKSCRHLRRGHGQFRGRPARRDGHGDQSRVAGAFSDQCLGRAG